MITRITVSVNLRTIFSNSAPQWEHKDCLKIGLLWGLILLVFFSIPSPGFTLPMASDLPPTIQVRGQDIDLPRLINPLKEDPSRLKQHLKDGGVLYFKNCFLCHGDLLDGKGVFGDSFFPPPANLHQLYPTKRDNYVFWRIMKGGVGLPDKFQPWNSAMPAWENTLTTEEVWQLVLFIDDSVRHPFVANPPAQPSIKRGQKVYSEKCAFCHGETGKGDGPAAQFSSPRPRNFTKSHQKLRTTAFGKIPTDEDMFNSITRGMTGTAMPAWKHLPEVDRWSLVLYLKTLGKKFKKFKTKGKTHKIIAIPAPPNFTLASVARGKEMFIQNCSGCHGVAGRSDGDSTKKIVSIATDQIRPRNLTKSWTFRRGGSRRDLFLTLRTGLTTTAMPRFSSRVQSDQDIWDIVNYVTTLSPSIKPAVHRKINAFKIDGALPVDPDDPIWKTITTYHIPLGGQIMQLEKAFYPTVDNVEVQALHNGNEIAFKLRWDDPTHDPILSKSASVQESPTPPLPLEFQVDPTSLEAEDEPLPQEYPDSIALQFPIGGGSNTLPYFLNGDDNHPVNLWQWISHPNEVIEVYAQGLKRKGSHRPASQQVESKVAFKYGQYQLVMKRKLSTNDSNDVQFKAGQTIPIAVNVWDGSEGEAGTRMSVSSWFEMLLK